MKEEGAAGEDCITVTQVTHVQPLYTMKKEDEQTCGLIETEPIQQNGVEVLLVQEKSIREELAAWKTGEKEQEMKAAEPATKLIGEATERLLQRKNGVSQMFSMYLISLHYSSINFSTKHKLERW